MTAEPTTERPEVQRAESLARRILDGDRRALARAMTFIENEGREAVPLLDRLYSHTGTALRIGITGPPGAGKSSLTNVLTAHLREADKTVGIVCVDPTSPFTGGALLGDRVRMQSVAQDPGVFIRSMASRGSLGGLARTTSELCDLLDAYGKDVIFMETVGVGQSEVEVARTADTTVIVLSPESGDGIQTMKAGLMETGDIFVINKSDREGASKLSRAVRAMLELGHGQDADWMPPVLLASAKNDEGTDAILDALFEHHEHRKKKGADAAVRRKRIERKIRLLVEDRLLSRHLWTGPREGRLQAHLDRIEQGEATPYAVADDLLRTWREEDDETQSGA